MKEWVVSLTAVLADGTIIKTGSRAKKSSAGYNLTGLFCGSEGTLGLISEITLKVIPLPKNISIACISFDRVDDAVNSVIKTIQSGIQVQCVEFIDEVAMKAINS